MASQLRTRTLRLAASLPEGNPLRRSLLAFMMDEDTPASTVQEARTLLEEATGFARKKQYTQVKVLARTLAQKWRADSTLKRMMERLQNIAEDASYADHLGHHVDKALAEAQDYLQKKFKLAARPLIDESMLEEAKEADEVLQQAMKLAKQRRFGYVTRIVQNIGRRWRSDRTFYTILNNIRAKAAHIRSPEDDDALSDLTREIQIGRNHLTQYFRDNAKYASSPEPRMDEAQGAATVLQQALQLTHQDRYARIMPLMRDLIHHWRGDTAFTRILVGIKQDADDASYDDATREDVSRSIRNGLNYLVRHYHVPIPKGWV